MPPSDPPTARDKIKAWIVLILTLALLAAPTYSLWVAQDPATPRWMEWLLFVTGILATLGALGRLSIVYRRPEL